MFYKKGLPNKFERKKNWVGVKYTTGVLPVQYLTTGSNIPLIPQTVAAMDGIPIRASKSTKIPPHHQRLIETGLNFEQPEGTFGELYSTADVSRIEPIAAPGLITNGINNLSVLCQKLSTDKISIQEGQVIAILFIRGTSEIGSISNFGQLSEFGLPDDYKNIYSIINVE